MKMMSKLKVVKFIAYDSARNKRENSLSGIGGFFEVGMREEDLIERLNKKAIPYYKELKEFELMKDEQKACI